MCLNNIAKLLFSIGVGEILNILIDKRKDTHEGERESIRNHKRNTKISLIYLLPLSTIG